MPTTRHVRIRYGDVPLLVGTVKGALLLRTGSGRTGWEVGGPYASASKHWDASLLRSERWGRCVPGHATACSPSRAS